MKWNKARERATKASLMSQAKGRIDLEEFVEWLWEDFGIRVRSSWDDVIKAVVNSDEILPQDLAAFMISMGVEPDEGAWDVVPVARGLRGPGEPEKSGSN